MWGWGVGYSMSVVSVVFILAQGSWEEKSTIVLYPGVQVRKERQDSGKHKRKLTLWYYRTAPQEARLEIWKVEVQGGVLSGQQGQRGKWGVIQRKGLSHPRGTLNLERPCRVHPNDTSGLGLYVHTIDQSPGKGHELGPASLLSSVDHDDQSGTRLSTLPAEGFRGPGWHCTAFHTPPTVSAVCLAPG